MARNIWPLVQNRNEEEWTLVHSDEWRFPLGRVDFCNSAEPVCQYVGVSVQGLLLIAPERTVRSGRNKHQKMRQSAGTTMAFVTWRHVPRGTCHVPPREPLAKNTLAGVQPKREESESPNF